MKYLRGITEHYSRLLENILSLVTIRGLEYFISFVTLPYLVRVLGPNFFGDIVFAQAIIAYVGLITAYGFNMTAPRDIAQLNSLEERGRLFGAVFGAKLCLLIICSIFFIGIGLFITQWKVLDWPLYTIAYISIIGEVFFPVWFFQGVQRMRYITYANIAARTITTLGIFWLVRSPHDYLLAVFFQSIVPFLASIVAWIILYREYSEVFCMPEPIAVCHVLSKGWDIFIASLAINIYTSSTVVILGLVSNNMIVGYFSAASKMINAVTQLLSPISQAIYPYVSNLAARSKHDVINFIRKLIILLGGAMGAISLLLFIFSEHIVILVLGDKFFPAIIYIKIMAFLPFIIALSNLFGMQTMMVFGMQKIFRTILLGAACLHLFGIIPLCLMFNGSGAAVMTLLTELFVTVAMGIVLKRRHILF